MGIDEKLHFSPTARGSSAALCTDCTGVASFFKGQQWQGVTASIIMYQGSLFDKVCRIGTRLGWGGSPGMGMS